MGRARYSIFKEQRRRRTGLPAKGKYTTAALRSQGFFKPGTLQKVIRSTFLRADKDTFFKGICQEFSHSWATNCNFVK
jgi:hypothetical protein